MVTKLKSKKKIKQKKQIKKLQKEMQSKMTMFDRMSDSCEMCGKEFERTKETVKTWSVQVYSKDKRVILYCPDCKKIVDETIEKINGAVDEKTNAD